MAARAPAIARASLTLRQDRAAGTTVAGSQALLRRLVDNVVDNAIVHNQRAGWIAIATQAGPGTARIVVENGGPMLDQAEVGQLVQPFRRLGADRIAAGRGQASACRSSRPRSPPTAASSTCGQGPVRRVAARDGRLLELSVKELGVLEALLRASPAFLRAEDLLEQVWDEYADPFTNTVTSRSAACAANSAIRPSSRPRQEWDTASLTRQARVPARPAARVSGPRAPGRD